VNTEAKQDFQTIRKEYGIDSGLTTMEATTYVLQNLIYEVRNLQQSVQSIIHQIKAFDHSDCTDSGCDLDEFVDAEIKRVMGG
jgi:hypothetical protein